MGLIRRFLTGPYESDASLKPGIVDRGDLPTLVKRDGTEVALEDLGGNGGSLPAQWTVDAHGNVVIAPDDDTVNSLVDIQAPAGYGNNTSDDGALLRLISEDATVVFQADDYGGLALTAPTGQGSGSLRISGADNPSERITLGPSTGLVIQGTSAPLGAGISADGIVSGATLALESSTSELAPSLNIQAQAAGPNGAESSSYVVSVQGGEIAPALVPPSRPRSRSGSGQ